MYCFWSTLTEHRCTDYNSLQPPFRKAVLTLSVFVHCWELVVCWHVTNVMILYFGLQETFGNVCKSFYIKALLLNQHWPTSQMLLLFPLLWPLNVHLQFLFTSGFHGWPQLPLVPLRVPSFAAPLGHHPHPLHFGFALWEYRRPGTLLWAWRGFGGGHRLTSGAAGVIYCRQAHRR